MPDYTYTQIFPDLAESQHDLEVWLSGNVTNLGEGDARWSLLGHTHADAIQIDADQATGWTLPTTLGEITSLTVTSGLESLDADDTVLVDVTVAAQVSGVTAGQYWAMRLAVQDVLQDQVFTIAAGGTGTASGTSGAGGNHTHAVSGTSAAGSSHTHSFADTSSGPSRDHYHDQGSLVTAADGGHQHAADGSHTHGGTNAGSSHSHSISLASVGNHRHADPVSGYTGYSVLAITGNTGPEASHTHSIDSGGSHDHDAIAAHTHSITGLTGGDSRSHTHDVSGTSGAEAAHTHPVSFTSGGESAHTHSFSSAHHHGLAYSTGSLRFVGTVTVGAGKAVKVSLYAQTAGSAATVDKASFDGLIWVVPTSLAADLGGLDDLEDVDATTPTDGQVLTWSSAASAWIPAAALSGTSLDDLADVTIGSPANDALLGWNTATDQWIDHTIAELGLSTTDHNHDATYLALAAKAADSELLDGQEAAAFAAAAHDHAAVYSVLGHNHDADYLAIDGTAANSSLLEGNAAAAFALAGHTHTGVYSAADHNHMVDNLSNVTIADVQDGDVLTWDADTSEWLNVAPSAGATLDGIGDVTITTPADGDVLSWQDDPGVWVNVTPEAAAMGNVEDLADVAITTPADNEVFAYDETSGEWINQTPAEAALAAADHNHSGVYLAVDGKAADSDLLDSHDTAYFATADHAHDYSAVYLGIAATAADSDLFSGQDAEEWITSLNAIYAGVAHSHSLDDLNDVVASTVTDGNVLRADGSDWHSAALALADLSDVGTTTVTSGNVLVADGTDFDSKTLADAGIAAATHTHATSGSYNPSWSGPTVTHVSGQYNYADGICSAQALGTITAANSGVYYFTLPRDVLGTSVTTSGTTNVSTPVGSAMLIDANGNCYVGICTMRSQAGSDTANVTFHGSAAAGRWSATVPITPANGDTIMLLLNYPCA